MTEIRTVSPRSRPVTPHVRSLPEFAAYSPRSNRDMGLRRPDIQSAEPRMNAASAQETPWPRYQEALETVNDAAKAMQIMEDHSHEIQNKAFELMQRARSDKDAASEQIATLQERLTASEAKAESLARELAEVELRAQTAQEWLSRFMETINTAFAFHETRQAGHNRAAA
jgi:predicted RNase H-like nuclease (RuvC/YqgF family)